MGYREYVRVRVARPNYTKEADPGNGFHLLHEVPVKPQLSLNVQKRIPELTDEQFDARQLILPKKQAATERRIREESRTVQKSISMFRDKAMAKCA